MRTSISLVAIAIAASSAAGQSPEPARWPVDSGSKIRVIAPEVSRKPQVGKLVAFTPDTIVFRIGKDPTSTAVPVASLARLDVANGTHQSKLRDSMLGLFFGALAGAALGAATYKPPKCHDFCFDLGPGFDAAVAGTLGGIVGSIAGLIVGSHNSDTWMPVNVPRR